MFWIHSSVQYALKVKNKNRRRGNFCLIKLEQQTAFDALTFSTAGGRNWKEHKLHFWPSCQLILRSCPSASLIRLETLERSVMVVIAFLKISVLFLANLLIYTLFVYTMFDDEWIQERFPNRKAFVFFVSATAGAIMHLPPNPPQLCYLKLCIGFAWRGFGSRWEDTRSFPHFRLSGTSFLNDAIVSKPSMSKTSGKKQSHNPLASSRLRAGSVRWFRSSHLD